MDPARFLSKYHVRCFFHFTDERNLPSIRHCGGLLSAQELKSRRVVPPAPGGDGHSQAMDRVRGRDGYVSLCLLSEHPLEVRARQEGRMVFTRFLQIDPRVLQVPDACFFTEMLGKPGYRLLSLKEAVKSLDFSVVYERHDWRDPAIQQRRQIAKKYELLIPATVPLTFIRGAD